MNLRTKYSYEQDSQKLLEDPAYATLSGVYSKCSLSQLQYFSTPENICPDATHDILEGSLQYELKLILRKLILADKRLQLEELNNRLRSFAYGVDSKNKPQPISLDVLQGKSKKLGMNASQAWCFGRYFCLLIADPVDVNYSYMQLIHMLLDIMEIIFAPVVTVSMTYRLEELVCQHHQLFRSLF